MYTNIKGGLYWLIALVAFGLFSCNDNGSYLGAAFGSESDFDIALVDTVTVKTSTIILDSVPTSGPGGKLMVGKYTDPKLGAVESQIYMQISNGTGWSPSDDATFDSMVLILPLTGYSYGDTTNAMDLHVYQATGDFETFPLPLYWQYEGRRPYFTPTSGYFFNTSSVDYRLSPELGSKSFKPRPNSVDSIHIRMPDNLGSSWLAQAKLSTNLFSSLTEFLLQFKGITIKAEDGSAILGVEGSKAKIRLYYKDRVSELVVQRTYDMPYVSEYLAFSNISADRQGTLLEDLGPAQKVIPSTLTDNESYIQSGLGILTKIEFPYVEDLLDLPGMLIVNNATLTIEPVRGTFSATTPLPQSLILFETDKSNQPIAALNYDYTSTQQVASIAFNNEYGTNSGYTFSITQYVQLLLKNPAARANGSALLLSTPLANLVNSVDRACVGDSKNAQFRTRLNIYYTYRK